MKYENKQFIYDRPKKASLKNIVKKALYPFYNAFIKLIVSVTKKRKVNKKYGVSICAIFKNEAKYLREWLTYHILIGVDHFYLYNNNSDDNYLDVLKTFMEEGRVTLIQWEKNQAQMEAYRHCIKEFSYESNWIGFIDIDEFIVPKKQYKGLKDILLNLKQPSLLIYWRMFGTSGNLVGEHKPVIERFVVSWGKYVNIGKCFYNTAYKFNFNRNKSLHHQLETKIGWFNIPPMNDEGNISKWEIDRYSCNNSVIQLNHYFTKSFQEYGEKCAKGDVYFKINPHDEEYFYLHEMKCDSVDYSAYKYLIKLKRILNNDN